MPANVAAAELSPRLRRLERTFDVAAIRQQALPAGQMVGNDDSRDAGGRKYHSDHSDHSAHSAEGAVDRALSDVDRFGRDSFYGRWRRIESVLAGDLRRSAVEMGLVGCREIVLIQP